MGRTSAWRSAAVAAAGWLALAACEERITAPGRCPELCPSDSVQLAETTLLAPVAFDTSIRGYTDVQSASVLLLADLDSLRSYGVAAFAAVPQQFQPQADTGLVTVGSYDSVQVRFRLEARDSTVTGLRVLIYRLPAGADTLRTMDSLAPYFVDARLVDSVMIPDTLDAGLVTARVPTDAMVPEEADSFKVTLGYRVRGPEPTAVVIASSNLTASPPELLYYARGAAPRDTLTRTFSVTPEADTYVADPSAADPAPGYIVVGNTPAARALLRLQVPAYLTDSAAILRATLVLRLVRPATGVPHTSFTVQAAPVLRDFGGKSIIFQDTTVQGFGRVAVGDSVEVRIEVARVLRLWRGVPQDSLPRLVELRSRFEEYNVNEFEAVGSGGAMAPRLEVTFMRPFRFGVP